MSAPAALHKTGERRSAGVHDNESRVIVSRVHRMQFAGAVVDGFTLTTAVLYFSIHVGVSAGTVGYALGAGALAALLLAPVLGYVADRIGLGRAAAAYSVIAAVALGGYAWGSDGAAFAGAAVMFLVSQAGLAAVRQALVAERVSAEERVHARALMHTLLNAGMGVGSVLGAVAIAASRSWWIPLGYGLSALVVIACGLVCAGLPRSPGPGSSTRPRPLGILVALRDARFAGITGLAAVLQLTMPVLSVLLPLWIAQRTSAPEWLGAALLGLNTAIVMALQTTVARLARSSSSARRIAFAAAGFLLVAGILIGLGAMPGLGRLGAIVVLAVAVIALTLGEMTAGAASWRAAFSAIPAGAEARYQAVFGMASSGARILGPALALPLALQAALAGWVVLAAVMATAALVLAGVLRRPGAVLRRNDEGSFA